MKVKYLAAAFSVAALLAGCGGGKDGPRSVAITAPPTVSAATITAAVLADTSVHYGQPMHFTVTGTKLTSGVTLASTACASVVTVAGATDTSMSMTCVPTAIGKLSVTFAPTNGSVQATVTTPDVPVPQVTMVTSMGTVVLQLSPTETPITSLNFIKYVNDGFYTNLIFHRVINGFMIQGGGYNSNLVASTPRYDPIALEVNKGLSNVTGTIAMARNSILNSATSQFFINVVDNTALDTSGGGGYAVFGHVLGNGMDVVNAIKAVPTHTVTQTLADGTSTNTADVPVTPVVILSATQTQ